MKYLIKGGRLVDPAAGVDGRRDLLVQKRRIAAVGGPGRVGADKGVKVIDAAGLLVVPGLIDMHVHLREPGEEYKEDIASGTEAAAAGGFTAVACMANTDPVNDNRGVTEFILRRAGESGSARVWPVAAMTRGLAGREMCEYGDLAAAGAAGVSDDGRWVADGRLMRRILEYARVHGLTPVSHPEDASLSGGVMNEGPASTRLGLSGIPAAAEDAAVARDVRLSELTGAPLHLAHVSTAGALEIIRQAKKRGVPVTAETAPHYFTLTDEAVEGYNSAAKMNPPLRSAADREAVRRALADGVLDAVASDHAPHSVLEKDVTFDEAAFGVAGLETTLGLVLELVGEGALTLGRAVQLLSSGPAGILNVPGGTLAPDSPADLTIIDTRAEWTVDPAAFKSKGRSSPFSGRRLRGRAVLTMTGGRITHNLLY